ncbi:MAG: hypothetical protein LBT46_12990 [Planctomycetaceae bacterium]|nr:hypothetical protein [Planctomycetaceae bacterium]
MPTKQPQKNIEAVRTKKGDENHFGYINHVWAYAFRTLVRRNGGSGSRQQCVHGFIS